MIERLVSGGQSGADRAALDAALALGLACGGWCPRGRWAEDGRLDARYPLVETPEAVPAQRTAWNVRDSDATLILAREPLRGGTATTRHEAQRLGRPLRVAAPDTASPECLRRWIESAGIRVLNVAGPRESQAPGLHAASLALLLRLLGSSPGG